MYRSGCWCPAGSQCVCAHPARQKIRLAQAVQQTSQSYFWNSTSGEERDKVMKILSRWINVAALTFVSCSGDGLGKPLGFLWRKRNIWLYCIFSSLWGKASFLPYGLFLGLFRVYGMAVQGAGHGARMGEVVFSAGPGRAWQAGSHREVLECLHFLR